MASDKDKVIYLSEECESDTISVCAAGRGRQPQTGEVCIFEYVVSGSMTVFGDGRSETVDEGSCVVVRRGQGGLVVPNETSVLYIAANGAMLERMLDVYLVRDYVTGRVDVSGLFEDIFRLLEDEGTAVRPIVSGEVFRFVTEIVHMTACSRFFTASEEFASLANRIRGYLDSAIYSEVSLDDISKRFGITKVHATRVFRSRYGLPPIQYLAARRLKTAETLLLETSTPINEIASMLCYSNSQHFSSVFHKIYGCTPREYRKNRK